MTDFYSQNRCVCSTRSHGPLLCAFCLSFHFNNQLGPAVIKLLQNSTPNKSQTPKYMLHSSRAENRRL